MVATGLTQVHSDEDYNMAIKLSATEEDAASCIENEERDALDTAASDDDIDLAALMRRYKASLSVSMSGEEDASQPPQKVESADSDVKEADDDDLDEDEYVARANNIMQRYKLQYALSDDSEQTSAASDDDDVGGEEESQVDVDEVSDTFRGCIEDRAEELINKCRQGLASSDVKVEEEEEEEEEEFHVEIGVEMGSQTFEEDAIELVVSETVKEEHQEEVKSESVEEDDLDLEQVESGATGEEDLDEVEPEVVEEEEEKEEDEIGEEIQEEVEEVDVGEESQEVVEEVELVEEIQEEVEEVEIVEDIQEEVEEVEIDEDIQEEVGEVEIDEDIQEEEDLEEVEIGEEIQEEEVVAASTSNVVTDVEASTSIVVAEVEASTSNATDECEDLEEMVTKLMQENDQLKKKKELQKRIYELSQENEQLKKSPKRNALADMACKFDDAVTTAVAKVSKIMVCAPSDEDIFDPEEGFTTMSEVSGENQNGVCAVGSDESDDFGRFEYDHKQVQVLSPVSLMTDENTNYLQTAPPAHPSTFQLKMQAYNQKYQLPQEPVKPKPSVTIEDALREARVASGVSADTSLDDAMRRVEEAKKYIKNRSVLKAQQNF
jgi:hypothetical protein